MDVGNGLAPHARMADTGVLREQNKVERPCPRHRDKQTLEVIPERRGHQAGRLISSFFASVEKSLRGLQPPYLMAGHSGGGYAVLCRIGSSENDLA